MPHVRPALLLALLVAVLAPACAAAKLRPNRDRDHDGLSNRLEKRFGMDPRKADSDGDGIVDGAENAGVVTSIAGDVVTIRRLAGDPLVAAYGCDSGAPATSEDASDDVADGEDVADDDTADDVVEEDDSAAEADDARLAHTSSHKRHKRHQARHRRPPVTCPAELAVGALVSDVEVEPADDGLVITSLKLL